MTRLGLGKRYQYKTRVILSNGASIFTYFSKNFGKPVQVATDSVCEAFRERLDPKANERNRLLKDKDTKSHSFFKKFR